MEELAAYRHVASNSPADGHGRKAVSLTWDCPYSSSCHPMANPDNTSLNIDMLPEPTHQSYQLDIEEKYTYPWKILTISANVFFPQKSRDQRSTEK